MYLIQGTHRETHQNTNECEQAQPGSRDQDKQAHNQEWAWMSKDKCEDKQSEGKVGAHYTQGGNMCNTSGGCSNNGGSSTNSGSTTTCGTSMGNSQTSMTR